ncbi:MAG: leucine-rich repeat protein [Clostridia bacterium]|nr:leucine-rich repeat protein [Clostridia bacterium]
MIDYVEDYHYHRKHSMEIHINPEYVTELKNKLRLLCDYSLLLSETCPSFRFYDVKLSDEFAQILYANGVMNAHQHYVKKARKKINDDYPIQDIECLQCGNKWKMLNIMMAPLTRCPWCGAELDGKGISGVWDRDNSQFPEDCIIANGKLISRRYYSLEFYNVPDCVTEIGDGVFNGSPETSIHIGANVKKIGNYAFANMPNLLSVEFEEGCEIIADNAFQNCPKLEHVSFPTTLKQVGLGGPNFYYGAISGMFVGCTSLKKIVLPPCLTLDQYETEANLLPKDAKIYIAPLKSKFDSYGGTYSTPGGYTEHYNVYVGDTRVATIRGGYQAPTYTSDAKHYSMPDNVEYGYKGTPEVVPFLWDENKSEHIRFEVINDYGKEYKHFVSISNYGMLIDEFGFFDKKRQSIYCHKSIDKYDAASIMYLKIKKPQKRTNGEITLSTSNISLLSDRGKRRYIHMDRSYKYSESELEKILAFTDALRENGVFVEFEN